MGVRSDDGRSVYCPDCGAVHDPEQGRLNIGTALTKFAGFREAGNDPAHGAAAKRKRAQTPQANMQLNREWEASNAPTMPEAVDERLARHAVRFVVTIAVPGNREGTTAAIDTEFQLD